MKAKSGVAQLLRMPRPWMPGQKLPGRVYRSQWQGMKSAGRVRKTVFQIKVGNTGTGPAQRMVLTAKLSDGLLHPQGMVIEAELANLPPGEIKTIPLKVTAGKAGLQWCQITVAAEGSADATGKASVNVVEPLLQIAQSGPAKCHVRAEPTYEINPLQSRARLSTEPITLYCVLPESFEFLQANDNGLVRGGQSRCGLETDRFACRRYQNCQFEAQGSGCRRWVATHHCPGCSGSSSYWSGFCWQPGTAANGPHAGSQDRDGRQGRGLWPRSSFEVTDLEDPVEVGKEAVYEIRVTNQGTGLCTNVQLVAALAEGTSLTGSSGPTQIKAQGQHLVFEPIQQLPVKGEVVYRVRVKSSLPGDMRFRVQLTCDQVRTPVVKEESTSFYKE